MVYASIVVPTYNERENLGELVGGIFKFCRGIDVEVIIVDDESSDGTGTLADDLSKSYKMLVVHRRGGKGLSSAVVDGFSKASGSILGVMDADLSHPPEVLPSLIGKIDEGFDVVFASRKIAGGGVNDWPLSRKIISGVASLLARPLTKSTDPMSGFFVLKKEVIEGVHLNPLGFKIGLEVLVKGHYRRYSEVPYTFKDRTRGESKLDFRQYADYLRHLMRLYAFKLKLL